MLSAGTSTRFTQSSSILSARGPSHQKPAIIARQPIVRSRVLVKGANVMELETSEDYEKFIASPDVTIVDFYTTWCGPCKAVAPKVEELAGEVTQVKFGKICIDKLSNAGEFAKANNIKALPTFHAYKKGEKVGECVGAQIEKLRKLVFCYV